MATLSILGGAAGARQDPEKKEDTDGASELTVGSPTPLSQGGTGDGDSEGGLMPLPSARTSVPAASCAPSRSARLPPRARLLAVPFPREERPQHVARPKWMESSSLLAAAEQMRLDVLTSGTPATLTGVAERLRAELSLEGPVLAERVADLFRSDCRALSASPPHWALGKQR
ncbi:hypothetical protein ACSSS7_006336 [Eimeria intestinalis]